MKPALKISLAACAAVSMTLPSKALPEPELPTPESKIQMAILLDTSDSMSGLINQARTQIWSVVNEFAKTEKHGKQPKLEIALYQYGNSRLSVKDGYIQKLVSFTGDLDLISEKLFALTTAGGSEYCGAVIKESIEKLDWSDNVNDYKVIFIAGNEPFTQGDVDYKQAVASSIGKGITVNTIYCGNWDEGIATHWADGAKRAEGKYMNIDQDAEEIQVKCPQDQQIIMLNQQLNSTYISYGSKGTYYQSRQIAQDTNARNASLKTFSNRAASKSQKGYSNSHWDLCDASQQKDFDLSKIDEKDLPENMQKMTLEERKQYVKEMIAKRAEIQKELRELNAAREKYAAAERARLQGEDSSQLESVVITTVREQATKKHYIWK